MKCSDDPESNAIDAVIMLSYREDGKDGLADTMDEVAGLLQDYAGLTFQSQFDVGADDDATVFDLGLLAMMTGGRHRLPTRLRAARPVPYHRRYRGRAGNHRRVAEWRRGKPVVV